MTQLCVSIFASDPERAKRDIAAAAEAGAQMVELRVDELGDSQAVIAIVLASTLPCIVTCRPTWEGGRSALDDAARLDLLRAAAAAGASYVDVELVTLAGRDGLGEPVPREKRSGIIISSHDFQGRPAKLHNLIAEMDAAPADVNKIVWTARSIRDNLEVFEILQQRSKPTIALCMGEEGLISRVLARKFGGFLTFASVSREEATAAGQISVEDMKRLYRWDSIGPATKVYGVVAHPVAHSMSPALHNAAFDQTGHDGVYLPMLVRPGYESFKAFMESFLNFDGLNLSGLSVTLPHKENAFRYLQEKGAEVEPLATRIGAVNTIVVNRSASTPVLRGMNTDYRAILDSITEKLGIKREQVADLRVAVIGAGGTGRTAVAALAHYGATVVVHNRTRERADALAAEFNGQTGQVVAARLEKLCDSCCHIFINTTSLGMFPKVDASPLGQRAPEFTADTLVFDTIYNPPKTLLLRQAEEAGAKTIGGIEMFVRQAAAQFEAWTGRPAPSEVMRKVVEKRLAE